MAQSFSTSASFLFLLVLGATTISIITPSLELAVGSTGRNAGGIPLSADASCHPPDPLVSTAAEQVVPTLTLLTNGKVFSPAPMGVKNILLAGGTIAAILDTEDLPVANLSGLPIEVAALRADGLRAYMWVGCYRVPSPTLTGSLVRDMALVDEVVGAGEIAVSDHRSSWPSTQQLLAMATDARVGGMLTGKRGVLHLHVGDASSLLGPLWSVVEASAGALPLSHLLPTHVSMRGPALLEDGARWVRHGGHVDFTADQVGENATLEALLAWHRDGVPLSHVSLSSDAFGSLPEYDASGRLVRYGVFSPASLLRTVRSLVLHHAVPLPTALQLVTSNPATYLGLHPAGRLKQGLPGDLLVLREADLALRWSFGGGQKMLSPGWVKKGMFEK